MLDQLLLRSQKLWLPGPTFQRSQLVWGLGTGRPSVSPPIPPPSSPDPEAKNPLLISMVNLIRFRIAMETQLWVCLYESVSRKVQLEEMR